MQLPDFDPYIHWLADLFWAHLANGSNWEGPFRHFSCTSLPSSRLISLSFLCLYLSCLFSSVFSFNQELDQKLLSVPIKSPRQLQDDVKRYA